MKQTYQILEGAKDELDSLVQGALVDAWEELLQFLIGLFSKQNATS